MKVNEYNDALPSRKNNEKCSANYWWLRSPYSDDVNDFCSGISSCTFTGMTKAVNDVSLPLEKDCQI